MIRATTEDRLKWFKTVVTTNDAGILMTTLDRIWEDGYRCAEAEVTYAITPEEVRQ
jgi:hypothetical protein